jgi:hypothetical protein
MQHDLHLPPCHRPLSSRRSLLAFGAAAVGVLSGCASIGPGTVSRDRIDYLTSIGESWKEQTLMNVVRLRYGDAPTFLEVSSVVSGYTFQGQLAAGVQLGSGRTNTLPRSLTTIGGNATYVDRPTISYTPISGDRFTRSMLRPIPPQAVFELIEAGYPGDSVLLVTTRGLNGIRNRSSMGGREHEADARFYPLVEALRRLQLSGAVSIRRERRGPDEIAHLIIARPSTEETRRDLEMVSATLGLRPDRNGEITIAPGSLPRAPSELAILTRSMVEMLVEIAAGIDVPEADVAAGRTGPSLRRPDAAHRADQPLIRVHTGPTEPGDAFAAVQYRDNRYWVDDRDFASKRAMTILMLFFSLTETGVVRQAPVLTVPAS